MSLSRSIFQSVCWNHQMQCRMPVCCRSLLLYGKVWWLVLANVGCVKAQTSSETHNPWCLLYPWSFLFYMWNSQSMGSTYIVFTVLGNRGITKCPDHLEGLDGWPNPQSCHIQKWFLHLNLEVQLQFNNSIHIHIYIYIHFVTTFNYTWNYFPLVSSLAWLCHLFIRWHALMVWLPMMKKLRSWLQRFWEGPW